jgi:hypothetical protein
MTFSQPGDNLVDHPVQAVGRFSFGHSGLPRHPPGELCLPHCMLRLAILRGTNDQAKKLKRNKLIFINMLQESCGIVTPTLTEFNCGLSSIS